MSAETTDWTCFLINATYSVQVGFRASMSTNEPLLDLVEEITTTLENNKYTVGVFIAPKKAFDTVDHDK